MPRQLKVLSGGIEKRKEHACKAISTEEKLRHFQNVNNSLLQEALNTWGDIWNEFQGSVTHGFMVIPEAEENFQPKCGWPEFLERIWLLKTYVESAKRFCEGKE